MSLECNEFTRSLTPRGPIFAWHAPETPAPQHVGMRFRANPGSQAQVFLMWLHRGSVKKGDTYAFDSALADWSAYSHHHLDCLADLSRLFGIHFHNTGASHGLLNGFYST